jgi:hypothetical protein
MNEPKKTLLSGRGNKKGRGKAASDRMMRGRQLTASALPAPD